jgi:hypothetical protein
MDGDIVYGVEQRKSLRIAVGANVIALLNYIERHFFWQF